jgi:hypothetical protein
MLAPFIERLQRINQALGALPGCHQNRVLTGTSDTAEVSVVTIVAWASAQSMAAAKALMQQRYADEGFDPAAFMRTLGVRADMGLYTNAVCAAEEGHQQQQT